MAAPPAEEKLAAPVPERLPGADLDFDAEIDRTAVPALKVHPMVLGDGVDPQSVFAAGVADMDFPVCSPITAALQRRLAHGVFGYESAVAIRRRGVSEEDEDEDRGNVGGVERAMVQWVTARHEWNLRPQDVLRAPNVLNALGACASLFAAKGPGLEGGGVIVQPPVFFDFFDVIRENGRVVLENPLVERDGGRYEMDFEGLEVVAADPRAQMLFLCNPHNPVGRVWTRPELEKVAEICARHSVLVVSDEMHGDLTFPGHSYTPFSTVDAANSITCLSPAKTFNIASCCSAFTVVTDEARRKLLRAENSRLTVNKNNAFANVAMEAAYRDGGPWLDAVLEYIFANVALVRERLAGLPEVKLVEPEGTFLLWLDFRQLGMTAEGLTDFLRSQARWYVTRGAAFGERGIGFARVNVACSRRRLSAAMTELETAVKSLR
jgi:cysteine-S-conjugate beta-lyase